jgi:hypothetical protein
LCTRPRRHAQIDGLTKCIVRTPLRFSFASTPRLNSGASTPMKSCTRRREELAQELRLERKNLRQPRQHLDRVPPPIISPAEPRLASGCLHSRPGDADEAGVRQALAHRADERRSERVAGRLAGNDADGHATGVLCAFGNACPVSALTE